MLARAGVCAPRSRCASCGCRRTRSPICMATLVDGHRSRAGARRASTIAPAASWRSTSATPAPALMITGMLYVVAPALRLHAQLGLAALVVRLARADRRASGRSFILLHSAAKLDNWVSLAFWSMIVHGGVGPARPLPDDADRGARLDGGDGDARRSSRPLDELRAPARRACAPPTTGSRPIATRRDSKIRHGGSKNGAPTFFGALWTCFWVVGRRPSCAAAASARCEAR